MQSCPLTAVYFKQDFVWRLSMLLHYQKGEHFQSLSGIVALQCPILCCEATQLAILQGIIEVKNLYLRICNANFWNVQVQCSTSFNIATLSSRMLYIPYGQIYHLTSTNRLAHPVIFHAIKKVTVILTPSLTDT